MLRNSAQFAFTVKFNTGDLSFECNQHYKVPKEPHTAITVLEAVYRKAQCGRQMWKTCTHQTRASFSLRLCKFSECRAWVTELTSWITSNRSNVWTLVISLLSFPSFLLLSHLCHATFFICFLSSVYFFIT